MAESIILRPEAINDLLIAKTWYDSQYAGLGRRFVEEFDRRMILLSTNPLIGHSFFESVRKIVMRKFPFTIFYIPEEQQIVILACLHSKRDPQELAALVENRK